MLKNISLKFNVRATFTALKLRNHFVRNHDKTWIIANVAFTCTSKIVFKFKCMAVS